MDKINLQQKLAKGMEYKEIIKEFFTQIYTDSKDNLKDSKLPKKMIDDTIKNNLQRKLDRVIVKTRSVDPRLTTLNVYAVCSQEEIDKLISFDSDYVSYKKEIKKISKLKKHRSMKFEVYNINYNEDVSSIAVNFAVIKDCNGAYYVKNIIIAEDDLAYAKANLDNCDVMY